MTVDLNELFQDLDSHLTADPSSTLESLAQKLGVTTQHIEQAVREVDGVSFSEYQGNKELALTLKVLRRENRADARIMIGGEQIHQRFSIPGATVCYLLRGSGVQMSAITNPYPLIDLSSGGLAFLADRPVKPGRNISLILSVSATLQSLRLEGRIVYALAVNVPDYQYRVGVKFQPFGAERDCNPPEALEAIARLERYGTPVHGSRDFSRVKQPGFPLEACGEHLPRGLGRGSLCTHAPLHGSGQ